MKEHKSLMVALCALITVAAAVAALIVFKNEINGLIAELKGKIDEKKLRRDGEYADYADV